MTDNADEWGAYGIPGINTVKVIARVSTIIKQYFTNNGLNIQDHLEVGAGYKCLVIELFRPLSTKVIIDIEQIVKKNIPDDYRFNLLKLF